MSDPLYRKEVLRLAADAHGAGRLQGPHVTGHAHNLVCADKITVDLTLANGRIVGFAQDTKACVLTQASASILGRDLNNLSRAEVEALRSAVEAMLEVDGVPPAPPFEAYAAFAGVTEFAGRHRCVLLPFDAILSAFAASEASEPDSVGSEH